MSKMAHGLTRSINDVTLYKLLLGCLLGYLLDKLSSPDGTTRINLLYSEPTVSD